MYYLGSPHMQFIFLRVVQWPGLSVRLCHGMYFLYVLFQHNANVVSANVVLDMPHLH